jgi:hypothetical protein
MLYRVAGMEKYPGAPRDLLHFVYPASRLVRNPV